MARNGGKRYGKRPKPNYTEMEMEESLDKLSEFSDFIDNVPKKLRDALIAGKDAKALYKEFSHIAAARAILIAMTAKDAGQALSAIKDIQDRAHGKATENKQVSHQFENLEDKELDAILASEFETLEQESDSNETH